MARSVRNRWTPLLCECLAIDLSNPKEWLEHFIVTGLPAELGAPFLRKVVTDRMDGWEESIAQCFGDPRYERIATYVILSLPDVNNELLAEAGIHAGSYPEMVETMCLWQQVPDRTLKFLLNHENLLISTHAAVGEWCAIPKGEVRVSISEEWKQAILKAEGHEFWIGEILKGDKALAFDWVIRRIQGGSSLVHFFVVNELKAAISVLDSNQRLAVLHHINIEGYSTSVLISELGKEDLQVYAAILKEPRFSKYHLASLGGHPTELWTEKVIRAISAGYSPDQIANSTLHYDNSWSGDESAMWQRWIDDFNSFRTHPDPGVCSVAELGITKALQRQALAAEEEHREAVYGI